MSGYRYPDGTQRYTCDAWGREKYYGENLFGWDLGHIETDANIDGIPFENMKIWIAKGYEKGGINTISWHARVPGTKESSWTRRKVVNTLLPGGDNHEAFVEKTGYQMEEVIGKNPRILQSGKTSQNTYQRMWDSLKNQRPWKGEFYATRSHAARLVLLFETADHLDAAHAYLGDIADAQQGRPLVGGLLAQEDTGRRQVDVQGADDVGRGDERQVRGFDRRRRSHHFSAVCRRANSAQQDGEERGQKDQCSVHGPHPFSKGLGAQDSRLSTSALIFRRVGPRCLLFRNSRARCGEDRGIAIQATVFDGVVCFQEDVGAGFEPWVYSSNMKPRIRPGLLSP